MLNLQRFKSRSNYVERLDPDVRLHPHEGLIQAHGSVIWQLEYLIEGVDYHIGHRFDPLSCDGFGNSQSRAGGWLLGQRDSRLMPTSSPREIKKSLKNSKVTSE